MDVFDNSPSSHEENQRGYCLSFIWDSRCHQFRYLRLCKLELSPVFQPQYSCKVIFNFFHLFKFWKVVCYCHIFFVFMIKNNHQPNKSNHMPRGSHSWKESWCWDRNSFPKRKERSAQGTQGHTRTGDNEIRVNEGWKKPRPDGLVTLSSEMQAKTRRGISGREEAIVGSTR